MNGDLKYRASHLTSRGFWQQTFLASVPQSGVTEAIIRADRAVVEFESRFPAAAKYDGTFKASE